MTARMHPAVEHLRGVRLAERDVLAHRVPVIVRGGDPIERAWIPRAGELMCHPPGSSHLIGLKLRRAHQTRVRTQGGAPKLCAFGVGQCDDVGGHFGRGSRGPRGLRRCVRRQKTDDGETDEHRSIESLQLTAHAGKAAIDEPVQLREDDVASALIPTAIHILVTSVRRL